MPGICLVSAWYLSGISSAQYRYLTNPTLTLLVLTLTLQAHMAQRGLGPHPQAPAAKRHNNGPSPPPPFVPAPSSYVTTGAVHHRVVPQQQVLQLQQQQLQLQQQRRVVSSDGAMQGQRQQVGACRGGEVRAKCECLSWWHRVIDGLGSCLYLGETISPP